MKKYWQSLDQLNETPEFLETAKNEFAEDVPTAVLGRKDISVPEKEENGKAGLDVSRRDFLKMMGFTVGAATLAACETPVHKTIPYVVKPEDITPGIANWYASTYFDGHDYCSILVKTREGRPIKIEGNKKSKITNGGTSARVQASVLSLYDSERLKGPMMKGEPTSWDKIDSEIGSKLSGNIRILSSTIISPSTKSVIANFSAKHPGTRHVTYDAVSYYAIAKANNGVIPSYNFDKANVIVSFAADFLVNWLSPVEYAWQYAQGRKLNNGKKTLSKHIQFETTLSLTGSNADVRIPVKPSQIGAAAATLYNAVASLTGGAPVSASGNMTDEQKKTIADSARWLADNKGRSLVVCGINDEAIQTIVAGINQMLGNYGQTIDMDNHSNCHQGNDEQVKNLLEEMKVGKVDVLIIYNANPAYTLPGFADALQKVKTKISFAATMDETASLCDYVCPDHHYLEAWNDAQPKKNSFSLAQPTIPPIYNTRAAQETLMKWCGMSGDYYGHIQATWERLLFPAALGFIGNWNRSLHDGVAEIVPMPVDETAKKEEKPAKKQTAAADTSAAAMIPVEMQDEKAVPGKMSVSEAASLIAKEKGDGIELFIYEKTGIGIGNQANNPWLQELPDPISKCTWDNYITMNPSDMKEKYSLLERGDYMGDVVTLTVAGKEISAPVFPQPGQALGTIGLALGYGRTSAGKVANAVGVDAYQFLQWKNGTIQNTVSGIQVSDSIGKHEFACTQTHHTIMGRHNIVRETNLETYTNKGKESWNPAVTIPVRDKDGNHIKGAPAEINLWDSHDKPGHRWGLAIDLQSCIGCGACVVSCSAENNVPVVGKTEIRKTREMHWIRIDRYYSSDLKNPEEGEKEDKGIIASYRAMESPSENPRVVFQPIMCQHCNHAPCETVCPVLATTHSTEGVNQMIYNRCIGTRYCANNCPYKVRRFNWFQYDSNKMFADVNPASWANDLGRMVLNPDVVVRSRGVMEKCTFCVQRVQEGKLNAKKEGRALKDGEIEVACQSACPTNALLFGDLNNPETEISKWYDDERRYLLLEEIGVQPNAFYMTKVRNIEEEMPAAEKKQMQETKKEEHS